MNRDTLKDCKKIVIKIGSSTITHGATGELNLGKMEKLVRQIADLKGEGMDVVLVSSGAIACGRHTLGLTQKPRSISQKQALAALGQARLMMEYRKLFSEYDLRAAQILMTKDTIVDAALRQNAKNTFQELLRFKAVPIVNENDTISTYEIQFGDNDRLSALVSALIEADALLLLSDIEGLYTDDPHKNPNATLIPEVLQVEDCLPMAKTTSSSDVGTGGMYTKLLAGNIAVRSGVNMVIASGEDLGIIEHIMEGEEIGTFFPARREKDFDLSCFLR